MTTFLVAVSIIGLILIRIPIGFVLAISAVVVMIAAGLPVTTLIPSRLFNGANNFPYLAIPLYILTGQLMNGAGISARLINFASSLVGFIRGGLAHVNIVTSMFFAEISGSAVADAAALGSVFIPEMERKGYPRAFSAAVTSSAASVAIIIPPSIPMIIYGVTAGVSIARVFIGGIIPGVLAGLTMMAISYLFARVRNYPVEQRFEWGGLWESFLRAFWALTIPAIILGGIFSGFFTPTEAGAVAVVVALLLGFFVYRELRVRDLPAIFFDAGLQTAAIMLIVAASALLGSLLSMEQIPQRIAAGILALTGNKYVILALLNVFFLAVGLILHSAAAIVMVVPIVMPLVTAVGIDPVHFGVVVAFNLALGQQTPPVGTVLLTTATIAGLSVGQLLRENLAFMLGMLLVLILITYVPWTTLFLPGLMK